MPAAKRIVSCIEYKRQPALCRLPFFADTTWPGMRFLSNSPLKTPASIGGGMKAVFSFQDDGKEGLKFLKKEPFFHTVING